MGDREATEPERPALNRDAVDLLILFHGEVRAHLAVLGAMASEGTLPDRAELRRIANFFAEEVPLHDLDEEASLLPRLRRVERPDRVDKLLSACTHQHEHLEESLEKTVPYLVAVATGREAFAPEKMAAVHRVLTRALEPHMHMEELEILPVARALLDAATLQEIKVEMLARRDARRDRRANVLELEETT
jgi:hemerythrin-like domain-containing protein